MQEVYSVQAIREAEQTAMAAGVPGKELMRRAAQGILEATAWEGPVAIVCGSGNNGGDGYALAILLQQRAIPCHIYRLDAKLSADGRYYFSECERRGVPWSFCDRQTTFQEARMIVDCIFGTGFHGKATGLEAEVIQSINASGKTVLSIDIPSGIQGNNGLGEPAVCADVTASIGAMKPGYFLGQAKDLRGSVKQVDIGLRPAKQPAYLVESEDFHAILTKRKCFANKGSYGYVALIGGCSRYAGAAKLANLGCAALRSGCGVATLAVPASIAPAVQPWLLESTLATLPDRNGNMLFDTDALDAVLSRKAAAGVGMGWGDGADNKSILRYVLETYKGKLVLDADGLNTLAELADPALLRSSGAQVVLTPHVKEFSRLSGWSVSDVLENPIERAKAYAGDNGCTVLLKGPATVITDGDTVLLTDRGCPGMATAGSGDVLTGVLTGLLGWVDYSPLAVACGAYAAGLAGEYAAEEHGEISMLASDTVKMLPRAFQTLTAWHKESR